MQVSTNVRLSQFILYFESYFLTKMGIHPLLLDKIDGRKPSSYDAGNDNN